MGTKRSTAVMDGPRATAVSAVALLVGTVGPAARAGSAYPVDGVITMAITLVAGIAIAIVSEARWWLRAGLALTAGLIVVPVASEVNALWAASGLVLADWGIRGRPPVPLLPSGNRTTLVVTIVGSGVCYAQGRLATSFEGLVLSLIGTGSAILIGAHWAPRLGPKVARLVPAQRRPFGRGKPAAPLLVLALPGLLWWMVNIGLWCLGWLYSGEVGYRAWVAGLSSTEGWVEQMIARASVFCWVLGLLVIGGAVADRGRRAWLAVSATLLAATVAAVALATLGSWVWPARPG